MDFIKWLLPGIGIKRWISLSLLGLVFFAQGLICLGSLLWPTVITVSFSSKHLLLYMLLMLVVGAIIIVSSIRRVLRAVLKAYLEEGYEKRHGKVIDVLLRQNILKYAPKIVAIGGGTGLSMLLNGLREISTNITAVVTVADNGGSSGRLREMEIPAPGDIRNCILALATAGDQMYDLFNYRYQDDPTIPLGLRGHNFGNLFIATLTRITGDFPSAVRLACQVLAVQGKVLPVTDCCNVHLQAELADGQVICGESEIGVAPAPIKRLSLTPECSITEEVRQAIREADLIVIGPGSLYTSIIATLLPVGMTDALKKSTGKIVYISNIMTQAFESIDHTAADHIKAVEKHLGEELIDAAIINMTEIDNELIELYHQEGADIVTIDREELEAMNKKIIFSDLIDTNEKSIVRHSPQKVAWELAKYMFDEQKTRE